MLGAQRLLLGHDVEREGQHWLVGLDVSPNLSGGSSALVPRKVPWRAANGGTKTPEDIITCSISRRLFPSGMEGACRCCPEFGAPSPYKT